MISLLDTKMVNPLYQRDLGSAYVGDSSELMQHIPDGSVNLVFTSPPFALRTMKEYGNESPENYIDWFDPFAEQIKRILTDDGSFVVELGGAYLKGSPVRSLYQYELLIYLVRKHGFFLAQEFFCHNPSSLPSPAEWVNVRRERVKCSVNVIWWLSKTPHPKANNRHVLQPYSEAMKRLLKRGSSNEKKRPSGHRVNNFKRDNKGSIPPNLLVIPNTVSNDHYMRRCREQGVSIHPARFSPELPKFFINFLTDEGDVVLDPFSGSNTTGFVADALQRQWLAFECDQNYLMASLLRFEDISLMEYIKTNGDSTEVCGSDPALLNPQMKINL